jgi:N6-adenosine-specific RNA methylase IME4
MPPIHPAANLFPMLPDAELASLAYDIKENGLREPVIMFGAHLLDGRNRWRACELAGVEPKLRDWSGTQEQALRYGISLNLNRRHLDESQRAMVAARVADMRQGERRDLQQICRTSQTDAASLLSVAARSVGDARKVIDKGTPELAAAVDSGKVAVSAAALLVDKSPEVQRAIVDSVERGESKNVRQAIQKLNAADRREVTADEIADGAFPVIYADPPWEYSNTGLGGNVADKYPTMDTDAICAMPIGQKATSNAVLFLWATNPLLEDALRVCKAWGFEYKTNIAWTKTTQTTGFYCYGRHELLLICVRGACLPKPGSIGASHIHAATDEHSKKPDKFYELIERMYDGPYLEMFARRSRSDWTAFGNEQAVNAA